MDAGCVKPSGSVSPLDLVSHIDIGSLRLPISNFVAILGFPKIVVSRSIARGGTMGRRREIDNSRRKLGGGAGKENWCQEPR